MSGGSWVRSYATGNLPGPAHPLLIGDVLSFFDAGLKQATVALNTTANPSSIRMVFFMIGC